MLSDTRYTHNIIVFDMSHAHYEQWHNLSFMMTDWALPFMRIVDQAALVVPNTLVLSTVYNRQPDLPMATGWVARGLAFNEELREWADAQNAARLPPQQRVHVFDGFAATTNAPGTDGSHFGLRVNTALAQLLLNAIEQLRGGSSDSR